MNVFILLLLIVSPFVPIFRIEPIAVRCDYIGGWHFPIVGFDFAIIDNTSVRVFDLWFSVISVSWNGSHSVKTQFIGALLPNETRIINLDLTGYVENWTASGYCLVK